MGLSVDALLNTRAKAVVERGIQFSKAAVCVAAIENDGKNSIGPGSKTLVNVYALVHGVFFFGSGESISTILGIGIMSKCR